MLYLTIVDGKEVEGRRVFGDGKKMQSQCLSVLKFAYRNDGRDLNLTKIASGTGIPRISIDFIFRDYECRGENSTLHKVAKIHGFDFNVDKEWNKANKYKRKKQIISAQKT